MALVALILACAMRSGAKWRSSPSTGAQTMLSPAFTVVLLSCSGVRIIQRVNEYGEAEVDVGVPPGLPANEATPSCRCIYSKQQQ